MLTDLGMFPSRTRSLTLALVVVLGGGSSLAHAARGRATPTPGRTSRIAHSPADRGASPRSLGRQVARVRGVAPVATARAGLTDSRTQRREARIMTKFMVLGVVVGSVSSVLLTLGLDHWSGLVLGLVPGAAVIGLGLRQLSGTPRTGAPAAVSSARGGP